MCENDNLLKINGLKSTKNRKLILEVLEKTNQPMSAEQIFIEFRHLGEINFSTVYRTLSTLTEKSIILKILGNDGKSYYQINNHNHCHFLVCSECKKRIIIDCCPLEVMAEDLKKTTGFQITGHNLEFIGECPECLAKDR